MQNDEYRDFVKGFDRYAHIQMVDLYMRNKASIQKAASIFSFGNYFDMTGLHDIDFCDVRKYSLRNKHHFSPAFLQTQVLYRIERILGVNHNDKNVKMVKANSSGVQTYYIDDGTIFEYQELGKSEKIVGSCMDVLRNCSSDKVIDSPYHDLFRGAHKCCLIKNLSAKEEKKLVLNCDSMIVPIVPFLAYHYSEILHLDNRSNNSFWDIIKNFGGKEYLCALITSNIIKGKHLTNLK